MVKNYLSMIPKFFTAYEVDNNHRGSIKDLSVESLPKNEVTIQVAYSSLNYKDALSARGLNRVTKHYPHIPGIDAVGIIIEDLTGTYKPDDWVIVTGNDLGTNTYGGFGNLIRVPVEWVISKPTRLSPIETMMVGTAGFTSLYGIHQLQNIGIHSNSGPILVTGATGGVGSFSVFALNSLGFNVVAATNKSDVGAFLSQLGANSIISTNSLYPNNDKPLQTRKWAAAIETVGGKLLSAVLQQIKQKGAVACCGNILGMELKISILPFILRGISLLGIDSAYCSKNLRQQIWDIAENIDFSLLPTNFSNIVPLKHIDPEIDKMLHGKQKGRIIISHK